MKYKKVVVIGSNTIAVECVRILFKEYHIEDLVVIENNEDNNLSMLKYICVKKDINYQFAKDKADIDDLLTKIGSLEQMLIVSANNNYIFKKKTIDKHTIINFHYSYLPDYRGRNIPSWVIYNQEPYTGVSWHFVNTCIDDGSIIRQEKVELLPDDRAFDVVKRGMKLGTSLFRQFIGDILEGRELETTENAGGQVRTFSSKDLPDSGILNLNTDGRQIYATLRAYDYCDISIFPKLLVEWESRQYTVKAYEAKQNFNNHIERIYKEENTLVVEKKDWIIEISLEG